MNRAFRSIWNAALGAWVAVPETCARKTKANQRAAAVITLSALLSPGLSWACDMTNRICTGRQTLTVYNSASGVGQIGVADLSAQAWSINNGAKMSVFGTGLNSTGTQSFNMGKLELNTYNAINGGQFVFDGEIDELNEAIVFNTNMLNTNLNRAAINGGTFRFNQNQIVNFRINNAVSGGNFILNDGTEFRITSNNASNIIKGGNFTLTGNALIYANAVAAINTGIFSFNGNSKLNVGSTSERNFFSLNNAALTGGTYQFWNNSQLNALAGYAIVNGMYSFYNNSQLNINAENAINIPINNRGSAQFNFTDQSKLNISKSSGIVSANLYLEGYSEIKTNAKDAIVSSNIYMDGLSKLILTGGLNANQSSLSNTNIYLRDGATLDLYGETLTPASLNFYQTNAVAPYGVDHGVVTNNNAAERAAINLYANGSTEQNPKSNKIVFKNGDGNLDVNLRSGYWLFDNPNQWQATDNSAAFYVHNGVTLSSRAFMHTIYALNGSNITGTFNAGVHRLDLKGTLTPGAATLNLTNLDLHSNATLVYDIYSSTASTQIKVSDTLTVHSAPTFQVNVRGPLGAWPETTQRTFDLLTWENAVGLDKLNGLTPQYTNAWAYLTPTLAVNEASKSVVLTLGRITQPTNPGDGSTNPSNPGEGSTNPNNPGDGSTNPSNPGEGSTNPSNPGDGSTNPSNPGEGTTNPSNPGDGSTNPSNPGEGSTNPSNPGDGSTNPSNPGEGSTNPNNPGDGSTNPSNPGDGSTNPSNPGEGTTNPNNPGDGSTNPSNPGEGTTNPSNPGEGSTNPSNPGDGSTNPSNPGEGSTNPNNPGDGSTNPSNPGEGSTNPNNPGDGSTNPSNPGEGSTNPNNPGDGSTNPSNPGEGSTNPNNPGDGSTNPSNPGEGSTTPSNPGDGSTNPSDPGNGGTQPNNPIRFADLAQNANQRNVANAVEALDPSHPVYNYVETLPVGAPAQAFNSLSGAGHASIATGLRNLSLPATRLPLANLRQSLNAGLNPQALTAQVGGTTGSTGLPAFGDKPAWVEVVGNWQTLDGDSLNPDLKQKSTGLFLGYDNLLNNSDWHLGGSLGFTQTDSETNDHVSDADINSYSATLYAGRALALDMRRQLNLMAGLSYTYHDIESERWVRGMDQKLEADYNAHTAQVFGELGYVIGQPDRRFVEPFAGLTYSYLSTDSFSEKGGTAALKSQSESDDQWLATLGIRAQTHFNLGSKDGILRGSLAWQHAFSDQDVERTMAFVDGGQAFSVRGITAERDTAVVGLGALLNTSASSAVSLDYEGRLASGVRDHSASLKVQWNF